MPHTVALSGWPFYFLHLSTIKKVKKSVGGSKIEKEKKEETDGSSKDKNEFFRDKKDTNFNREDNSTKHPHCLCCLGVPNMEAGLLSINKLLMSVIGQPRGNLLTSQTPITNEFKISDTVLGLGINGKVVECVKKSTGQKFALKVLKDNAKSRREIDLHWRASSW